MNNLYNLRTQKANHLLVVDDSPDNLFLLETILEDGGYEVSLAPDGYSALRKIKRSPPDLVVLDVMMPGMSGYEVTRHIRQNVELPFIPILLVTASEDPQRFQEPDTSADAVIRKPIDINELLTQVNFLLELKHRVDAQSWVN